MPLRRGQFVPTTETFDSGVIDNEGNINREALQEFILRVRQIINEISVIINVKQTGYYPLEEFITGNLYFERTGQLNEFRPSQWRVIDFGTLPNNGIKTVPHNITFDANTEFVRIYGTATDPVGLVAIPIPFSSVAGVSDGIELFIDQNNVSIETVSDRTAFTICTVIIEYIQNN